MRKWRIPWNKGIKQWANKIPPTLGKHLSEEHRKKLSIARRKRITTQATRDKMRKTMLGRKILWKDKISKALKGKKCPWAKHNPQTFKKGFTPWNKGKKGLHVHSLETKRKMSEAHLGEKAPNWKGGITSAYRMRLESLDWRLIRNTRLKMDGYRCQICGTFEKKLEIHHIIPWRISHNDELDNLMTVCRKCHMGLERSWNNE